MKTIEYKKKYHKRIITAFDKYIKNDNLTKLLNELTSIEAEVKAMYKGKDKGLWFRFFHNDMGATSIRDIEHTFTSNSWDNRSYMLECMQICVETGELLVYYS